MSKNVQPTSLILAVAFVLIVVMKWAYDKGTGQTF